MKIVLSQIPETGLSGRETLNPEAYTLDTEEVRVASPLSLSYRAFLEDQNLLFHFSLAFKMALVCSRCLSDYETLFHKEGEIVQRIGKPSFTALRT